MKLRRKHRNDPQRFKVKLEESDDSDSEWKQMQGLEKKAKKKSRLKRLAGQGARDGANGARDGDGARYGMLLVAACAYHLFLGKNESGKAVGNGPSLFSIHASRDIEEEVSGKG